MLETLGHRLTTRTRLQVGHHRPTITAGQVTIHKAGQLSQQIPATVVRARRH
jgi:hypothetical protein